MSIRAKLYIGGVLVVGILLCLWAGLPGQATPTQWLLFGVLVTFAIAAHLFQAIGPSHEAWNFNLIFYFSGLLLLSPAQFTLLLFIPHSIEWTWARVSASGSLRNWYIQPFNVATHLIAGFLASYVLAGFNPVTQSLVSTEMLVRCVVAACLYAFLNHLLIGQALVWARNMSWRDLGILDFNGYPSDLGLLLQGYVVAVGWQLNPWLLLPALAPLLLMYRGLFFPILQREARIDDKTGLWNSRYIAKFLEDELESAKRAVEPLSVIMADLDLLRNINNEYGHLAGDQVLAEVGQLIRRTIGEQHAAGRFGGEEFCIVLPATDMETAHGVAAQLRASVDTHQFLISTSTTPIHVTISGGLACYPYDGATAVGLLHAADVALYQAKYNGRNRIVRATASVPDPVQDNVSSSVAAKVTTTPQEPRVERLPDLKTQAAVPVPPLLHSHTEAVPGMLYRPFFVALAAVVTGGAVAFAFWQTLGAESFSFLRFGPLAALAMTMPFLVVRYLHDRVDLLSSSGMPTTREHGQQARQVSNVLPPVHPPARIGDQSDDEMLNVLAAALVERAPYVRAHSRHVAELATITARALSLSPQQITVVEQAGRLHDIGKIGVPARILNKPSRLTPAEYEIVKQHSTIGESIVEAIAPLAHLAPIVRHHHERWDGRGYPDRLSGECIPIESRIIAVCDAVEVMASSRPYQAAKSTAGIIAELHRCSGTQFDPAIVRIFIQLLEDHATELTKLVSEL